MFDRRDLGKGHAIMKHLEPAIIHSSPEFNEDGAMRNNAGVVVSPKGFVSPPRPVPASGQLDWTVRNGIWPFGRFFASSALPGVARWSGAQPTEAFKEITTLQELRAHGPYRVFTPEECVNFAERVGQLMLRLLCGGMDPALSWKSLRLFENDVLPQLL